MPRVEITECDEMGYTLFYSDGSIEWFPYEWKDGMAEIPLDPNSEIFKQELRN